MVSEEPLSVKAQGRGTVQDIKHDENTWMAYKSSGLSGNARVGSLGVEAAPGVGACVEALLAYSEQVVGVQ